MDALGALHGDPANGGIAVAAVATAFPSGRASRSIKLEDTADAVAAGADEIDMVIDRGAFLAGRYGQVYDEIVAVKEACRRADGTYAHLKVILETGELDTYDNVRRASVAGDPGRRRLHQDVDRQGRARGHPAGDAARCSRSCATGTGSTGQQIGVKPAGGIRTSKDAIKYLVTVAETVGEEWLTPHLFRFGASSLLNDVLLQRQKMTTGHYSGPDYVTID